MGIVKSEEVKKGLNIALGAIEIENLYTWNAWEEMTNEEREEITKELQD